MTRGSKVALFGILLSIIGSLISVAGVRDYGVLEPIYISDLGWAGITIFWIGVLISLSSFLIKDDGAGTEGELIEKNLTPILSDLEWQFSSPIAPKHWKLIYLDRTVATLNLKSIFRYDFEGQFGEIPVRAEYRSKTDRTTITNKTNNEVIGIIDNFYYGFPSKFTMQDGAVYKLEYKKKVGFVLSDNSGIIIGVTNHNDRGIRLSISFTLYRDEPRLLSTWFVALITFYYALIHSSGT